MLADTLSFEQWPYQQQNVLPETVNVETMICPGNQGDLMGSSPSPTSSCPMFSVPGTPKVSPGSPELTENSLLLDDAFLELCLQSIQSDNKMSSGGVLEDDNPLDSIDNPMFDSFSDLSSILDPSMCLSLPFPCTSPLPEAMDIVLPHPPSSEGFLSPVVSPSPLSSLCSSSASSPSSLYEVNNSRKRKVSCVSEVGAPPETKVSKQNVRRVKNNAASKVSRTKRRTKVSTLFVREKELVVENAQLRLQVEEMTKEAERIKELLVSRLAQ